MINIWLCHYQHSETALAHRCIITQQSALSGMTDDAEQQQDATMFITRLNNYTKKMFSTVK